MNRQTIKAVPTKSMPKQQQGVALFISLVLLLILTIIGVSSVQTTSLEVRMTRNENDNLRAFQAAESALRDAEAQLELFANTAAFDSSGAFYDRIDFGDANPYENAAAWTSGGSVVATAVEGSVEAPRYMIELLGAVERRDEAANQVEADYGGDASTPDSVQIFRITARGVGGTPNARVFLQSTYGRIMD